MKETNKKERFDDALEEMREYLVRHEVLLGESIFADFSQLAGRLLEENRRFNLTAIQNGRDVVFRHFLDSLMPRVHGWSTPPEGQRCDVGSGGGFPGLVFALLERDHAWSFIEASGKKAGWLGKITEELRLEQSKVLHQRVENTGQSPQHRENYSLCLSRAVAKGPVMLEYCLPLVKVGGELWSWQGESLDLPAWSTPLQVLGGEVVEMVPYRLFGVEKDRKRYLVRIQKCRETDKKYPRRVGAPNKRHL